MTQAQRRSHGQRGSVKVLTREDQFRIERLQTGMGAEWHDEQAADGQVTAWEQQEGSRYRTGSDQRRDKFTEAQQQLECRESRSRNHW